MGARCAVCEDEEIWKRVALPDAWEAYLAETRDLEPVADSYLLPTCSDCSGDVDMQLALDAAVDGMDDDTIVLLDGLVLEALIEDASAGEN